MAAKSGMGLILAGGGAILLLGTKKKKKKKKVTESDDRGTGLPDVDDDYYEEDEDDEPQTDPSGGGSGTIPNIGIKKGIKIDPQPDPDPSPTLDNVSVFPSGYRPPVSVSSDQLFIDPNGEGYAIGDNFKPEVSIGGKKYDPRSYYSEFVPGDDPLNSWQVYPAPSASDHFVASLMSVWASASGADVVVSEMPTSGGMAGLSKNDFFNAWMAFAERYPAIAALFFDLSKKVSYAMMLELHSIDKSKYEWVFMHYNAENAIIDNWDAPIADVTDIAYRDTWPSAPEKITNKNSDWANKWNKMLGYVNKLESEMVAFRAKSPRGELPSWRYIEDVVQQQLG